LLLGPDLDELKGKRGVDVLGFYNSVYTLDGLIDKFLYFECVEEVQIEFFGGLEVIKQAI
jgi:hypothetical protein